MSRPSLTQDASSPSAQSRMAAVQIPPSPNVLAKMNKRRAPLADVPNAVNSPFRGPISTASNAGKRGRTQTADQRDLAFGQPPLAKRQYVESEEALTRRHAVIKRSGASQPTALQRKLEAARDPRVRQNVRSREDSRPPEQEGQNLHSIRQWQNHYRRVFPTFVFFLDCVPSETKSNVLRDLHSLKARDEQFFSRAVTHVVTTRPIPPAGTSSSEVQSPKSASVAPSTINPSILDRSQDSHSQGKTTETQRRSTKDVLMRAREMGMKIWALEKFERMMSTMFSHGFEALRYGEPVAAMDLSALLKHEKLHGPADRDLTVAAQDIHIFRGCYIYVHDMNEQTRPVMIRDYERPDRKEDGKWPQLRVTAPGRCPFIEDQSSLRRQKTQRNKEVALKAAAAQAPVESAPHQTADIQKGPSHRSALADVKNVPVQDDSAITQKNADCFAKPLDPPKGIPLKRTDTSGTESQPLPPLYGSAQANVRQQPRFVGGEPVASGMQPSNVTSAIKSQVISSTAAVPGARAGTSREVHQLKRKVLEKNSTASASANSMPSSYMNDVRAAINNAQAQPQRASRRLAQIEEDECEQNPNRTRAQSKKKLVERDLKPGYCENCQEKFNDFDDHIETKKHRKFANSKENWSELDTLLAHLVRI